VTKITRMSCSMGFEVVLHVADDLGLPGCYIVLLDEGFLAFLRHFGQDPLTLQHCITSRKT
jgi:hypothetical protein